MSDADLPKDESELPEDDPELRDQESGGSDDEADASAGDAETTEEEEVITEPDHQDAVAALRDLGARLDVDTNGHVWRIFFYERNDDESLAQIHGLPALRELWLLGTKVTKDAVKKFQEEAPKVTVYH